MGIGRSQVARQSTFRVNEATLAFDLFRVGCGRSFFARSLARHACSDCFLSIYEQEGKNFPKAVSFFLSEASSRQDFVRIVWVAN